MNERKGLSFEEVRRSRAQSGENRFTEQKKQGFFHRFFKEFGDPLILILLAALSVNSLFALRSGEWLESAGIAAAVFVAVFVSTLSEYTSERAFERLRDHTGKMRCRVRREGKIEELFASELVVGDLVLLGGGDAVPADGRIVFGSLLTDQSALNGESREMQKYPSPATALQLEHPGSLFCGSLCSAGEAEMQVEKVGDATLYGSIATGLQQTVRQSPLKEKLSHLARILSRIGYLAAALVGGADFLYALFCAGNGNLWHGLVSLFATPALLASHLLHALSLAVTIVVVAVPEGLPMMVTVVLSGKMRRLAREGVLVRKLSGIETAGTMDLLFCDKTGTLTRGTHSVQAYLTPDGTLLAPGRLQEHPLVRRFARAMRYCNQAHLTQKGVRGSNATDRALLEASLAFSVEESEISERIPFESLKKYAAVRLSKSGLCLYKGAAEKLLPLCSCGASPNGDFPLSQAQKNRLLAEISRQEKSGARLIALAEASGEMEASIREKQLCLLGFVALADPLRDETETMLRRLSGAGVQVVMLTGDSAETACAIARRAGLLTGKADELCLSGRDLDTTTDAELTALLGRLCVVSRCKPADKERLARLAEDAGRVVGMTGDGVNDAPALKRADVGFAMGSGTQIARDAADLILLDDSLSSLVSAVLYGRCVFRSIRKFLVFQLTMNFCAVLVSFLGPLFGIDTPITVLQMLWVNLIMDTLASLAFSGEPPRESYLHVPPVSRTEPILSREMLGEITFSTCFSVCLCCFFLANRYLRSVFHFAEDETAFLGAFFSLFVFLGVFNAFHVRTPRCNLFRDLSKNRAFLCILFLICSVQIAMTYFGGTLLRTCPLPLPALLFVICLALLSLPAGLLRKTCLRARKMRKRA